MYVCIYNYKHIIIIDYAYLIPSLFLTICSLSSCQNFTLIGPLPSSIIYSMLEVRGEILLTIATNVTYRNHNKHFQLVINNFKSNRIIKYCIYVT